MTMALTIASAAIGAISSVAGGMAANQASQYRASVAYMNKKIAEDNAKRAIERSQVEQQDQDMMTLAMLGEQEATMSASGLSLGSRSFVLTRKSAKELGRKDALNVRQAGELEAYNYKTDAVNFGAEASMAKAEGKNALLQGYLGAAGSLIGGASKIADRKKYGNSNWEART